MHSSMANFVDPVQNVRNNNLLIVEDGANQKRLQNLLFETAVRYATVNKHVIFVTEKPIDSVSPEVFSNYSTTYKKIIFIYSKSAEAVLLKLNDIKGWNFTPSLVIVESIQNLLPLRRASSTSGDDLHYAYSVFLASVLDTVRFLSQKQSNRSQCIITVGRNVIDSGSIVVEPFFQQRNVVTGNDIQLCSDVLDMLRECC